MDEIRALDEKDKLANIMVALGAQSAAIAAKRTRLDPSTPCVAAPPPPPQPKDAQVHFARLGQLKAIEAVNPQRAQQLAHQGFLDPLGYRERVEQQHRSVIQPKEPPKPLVGAEPKITAPVGPRKDAGLEHMRRKLGLE